MGKRPGPMTEDYAKVIRERRVTVVEGEGKIAGVLVLAVTDERFDSIYLYTHEKMTENLALYVKIGYVEFDRRSEKGLDRVYMRKPLQ